MKNRIIFLLFSILLSSCTHVYYIPNVQNVPLFMEKNEFRLSAHRGGGEEIQTTEVQSAYSVTSKIAIMANYMKASGGSSNDGGKGNYFDIALGYYKSIKKRGVFELYGGYGGCKQQHQYGYGLSSDLYFSKIFIQPSIGLCKKTGEIALSSRVCFLKFNEISTSGNLTYINQSNLDNIIKNKTNFLIEPALTLRVGWKYAKLQFQMVYSENLSNTQSRFEKVNFNIGLYIAIAERFWRD